MSFNRSSAERGSSLRQAGSTKAGQGAAFGLLLGVYLLCGRWGVSRLSSTDSSDWQLLSEMRLWVVLGLVLVGALDIYARPRVKRPGSPCLGAALWTCALLAYLAVSAAWSPAPDLAAAKTYDIALMVIATVAMALTLAEKDWRQVATYFWGSVFATGCALAVVALVSGVSGGGDRVAVLGGGPNIFARMMGYTLLACLYFWRRSGRTFIFLPVVSVAALLVLLSGSRGGLIALVIASATFMLLEVRNFGRLVSLGVVVALFSWGLVSYTEVGQAALARYDERVQVLLLQDRYYSGREHMYASAYELGMSEPVWGAGLAAFPGLRLGPYPHNVFLEVFSEGGSIGLVLLLGVLGIAILALVRRPRDGALVSALALSLVASQFSGDLYDSRGIFAFLMAIVSLRGTADLQKRQANRITRHLRASRASREAPRVAPRVMDRQHAALSRRNAAQPVVQAHSR